MIWEPFCEDRPPFHAGAEINLRTTHSLKKPDRFFQWETNGNNAIAQNLMK